MMQTTIESMLIIS